MPRDFMGKPICQFCLFFLFVTACTWAYATPSNTVENAWQLIKNKQLAEAQTLLEEEIERSPSDFDVNYLYARTLSWTGNHNKSLRALDSILKISPENTDVLLTKATVLGWQKKFALALNTVKLAKEISPGYKDIWILEFKILTEKQADKFTVSALEHAYYLQFLEHFDAPNTKVPSKPRNQSLFVSHSVDVLDNNTENWHSTSLSYRNKYAHINYTVSLDSHQRFGLADNRFSIAITQYPIANFFASASLFVSESNNLFSIWGSSIEASQSINKINELTIKWTHKAYSHVTVDSTKFGVSRYIGKFLPMLSVNLSALNNTDVTISYSTTLSYFFNDNNFIRFVFSAGKEAEIVDDSVDISNILFNGIDGRIQVAKNWNLISAFGHHKQGTVYTKNGIFFGIQHRF